MKTIITVFILLILSGVAHAYEGFAATADGHSIVAGGARFSYRTNSQDSDWLWLQKWSEQEDAWTPFLSTGKPIAEVEISPSGKYILVTDFTRKDNPNDIPDYTLHIYTSDKKHIASFPDICDVVFSPDELQVAMIVGKYQDGPYIPQHIIIYNFETKESRTIDHEANEIWWAHHDGNIYLKGRGFAPAYCYDVKNREIILTEYKGVFFSPGGTYYFNCFEDVIQILRTKDNVCIMDNEKTLDYKGGIYKAEWFNDEIIVFRHAPKLIDEKGEASYNFVTEILNLSKNTACLLPIENPIGMDKKNERIIYLEAGKIHFWNIQDILSDMDKSDFCRTVTLQ